MNKCNKLNNSIELSSYLIKYYIVFYIQLARYSGAAATTGAAAATTGAGAASTGAGAASTAGPPDVSPLIAVDIGVISGI